MTKIFLVTAFTLFTINSFAIPTVEVDGVSYRLITKNVSTKETYSSDHGYCKLQGYKISQSTYSQRQVKGPHAILNRNGEVIKTYQVGEIDPDVVSTVLSVDCVNR